MFQVEFKKSAKKEIDECPLEYRAKVIEACKFLRDEPYPFRFYDVRKVAGREHIYGIRIGRYRLIYEVFKEEKLILILKIQIKSETIYKF